MRSVLVKGKKVLVSQATTSDKEISSSRRLDLVEVVVPRAWEPGEIVAGIGPSSAAATAPSKPRYLKSKTRKKKTANYTTLRRRTERRAVTKFFTKSTI